MPEDRVTPGRQGVPPHKKFKDTRMRTFLPRRECMSESMSSFEKRLYDIVKSHEVAIEKI